MKNRPQPFSSIAVRLLLLLALASAAMAPYGPAAAQEADFTPPETILDGAPADPTESTEATFEFSSDDPDATFLCSIDGTEWAACASGITYTGLELRTYQFLVIAVDAAGNSDQTPAAHEWTIVAPLDTTPPETTITAGPDNPTEHTEATFAFSSDDPEAMFQCSLDGSDWESCTSGITYTGLGLGPHQFGVLAVDPIGNADQTPALHDWTIAPPPDTEAPTTTITGAPASSTASTEATFEFSSDDRGAGFECALDGGALAPCVSPVTYDGLAEGDHTFAVRAVDTLGNVEDPLATSAWTVAWAPLVEDFERGDLDFWTDLEGDGLYLQSDLVASGDYAVRGTSTGQPTVLVKTLTLPQQEVFYRAKFNLVDRGDNPVTLLQLFSTSGAPLATLIVDSDGRLAYRNEVDGATRTSSVVVTEDIWHEVELRLVVADPSGAVEVWYDGQQLAELSRSEALGSEAVGHISLGNGAANRGYDVAFDDVAVDTSFISADIDAPLDTTAPETTIASGPSGTISLRSVNIAFSSETGATFECALDGQSFSACTSPLTLADLVDGEHTFAVAATDPAGNTDASPATTIWTVDTTAPTVSASPAGGTYDTALTVALTASEPGVIYYTTDGSTPTTSSPVYSAPIAIDVSATLKVVGVDTAGNVSAVGTEVYTINTASTPTATSTVTADSMRVSTASTTYPAGTANPRFSGAKLAVARSSGTTGATSSTLVHDGAIGWSWDLTGRPTTGFVTLDLGTSRALSGVRWVFRVSGGADAMTVATSHDNRTWTTVGTFGNAPAKVWYGVNVGGTARYVRFTFDNPNQDAKIGYLAEAEVWGSTMRAYPTGTANPSLAGQKLRVASSSGSAVANSPSRVHDGSTSTAWQTTSTAPAHASFTLDLGQSATMSGLKWRFSVTGGAHEMLVQTSVDGSSWRTVGRYGNAPANAWYGQAAARDARLIRFTFYNRYGDPVLGYVAEVEVWGTAPTAPTLPTASASPRGGTYDSPQSVTLTASEPATVYYTVDGTTPTTASSVYSAPIQIAGATTLKFFARTADNRSSAIMTEIYTIQAIGTGYRDFSYGSGTTAPTAKESESKLWYADGKWWGALFHPGSGTFHIYRLNTTTQTWVDTGTLIDSRSLGSFGKIDALWDGSKLYVVTHRFASSGDVKAKVMRFGYAGGVYTHELSASVDTLTGPEVVTIAKDTTATLWLSWMHSNKIYVTHTAGRDTTWVTPYVIPVAGTTVGSDDLSTIVAFGGKIGVIWSNQAENTMRFAYHTDGASDSAWTGQVAYDLPGDAEAADDHINVKTDSSGRVYVVAKTSLNETNDPLIHLLVRSTSGGWTSHTVGTAGQNHTRPIVLLNEAAGQVYVFAAAPCCSGGKIYFKSASMSNPVFPSGMGTPIIASDSDPRINNVTSTKQNVSAATGLVILAGDDGTRTYLHNFLALGSGGAGGTTVAAATVGTPPGGDSTGLIETVGARSTAAARVPVALAAPFDGALDGRRAVPWPLLAILAAAALHFYPGERPLPGRRGWSETRPVRHRPTWPRLGFRAPRLRTLELATMFGMLPWRRAP